MCRSRRNWVVGSRERNCCIVTPFIIVMLRLLEMLPWKKGTPLKHGDF